MTINEIKKKFYKENPSAYLRYIRMGVAYYYVELNDISNVRPGDIYSSAMIEFEIPVNDMGNADFEPTMPAKHLLRWIKNI